jgi:hypothetical protein
MRQPVKAPAAAHGEGQAVISALPSLSSRGSRDVRESLDDTADRTTTAG